MARPTQVELHEAAAEARRYRAEWAVLHEREVEAYQAATEAQEKMSAAVARYRALADAVLDSE